MRMQMRCVTCLTNGFSKKLEKAAENRHFAHYNFLRLHRSTPAIAAGVSDRLWTLQELVEQNVAMKLATGMAILMCTGAFGATESEWVPSSALVALADTQVLKLELPEGFGSVSAYARYYWGTVHHGHRVVEGVLLSPAAERLMRKVAAQRVNIVSQDTAPGFADGGCMLVNVEYDVDASKLVRSDCNYARYPRTWVPAFPGSAPRLP